MTSYVVAVLTYRRPAALAATLPVTLAQICQYAAEPGWAGSLLVVDNDPAGSARETVAARCNGMSLRYVIESEPGIAAARNRALTETAQARLLIFLDDDEVPQPGWLAALLRTWADHDHPAAVMGRVQSNFDRPIDPWVAAGEFFRRRRRPTGTELVAAAAGNLLLDLDQVRALDLRFETRLGLGGGEDTLFTRQLHAAGGRIVFCDESVAVDTVPVNRTTKRWVLARSWSQGNNQVTVSLFLARSPIARQLVRGRAVAGGLLRVLGGAGRALVGVLSHSPRHQARGLRTLCRGGGMVAAALGSRYREYAR